MSGVPSPPGVVGQASASPVGYVARPLDDDVRALLKEAGYEQAPGVVVTTSMGLVIDCWGGFNPPRMARWAHHLGEE